MGRMAVPQRTPTGQSATAVGAHSGRGTPTPVATRIDADPSQATAWQMQSSVRHVQGPGGVEVMPHQSGPEFRPAVQPIRSESGDSYHSQGNHGAPPMQHPNQIPYRTR